MSLSLSLSLQLGGQMTSGAGASTPDAFTVGMWSVAENGVDGQLLVTVSTLPALNGGTVTRIEYRIDGGDWADSGLSETGAFVIMSGLTGGVESDIEIRVVASNGTSETSDVKAATPALTLGDLSVSASTVIETSAQGTTIGTLSGVTAGSTITITDTATNRVQNSGSTIQCGSSNFVFDTGTPANNVVSYTVRETNALATNPGGYHETTLSVTVYQRVLVNYDPFTEVPGGVGSNNGTVSFETAPDPDVLRLTSTGSSARMYEQISGFLIGHTYRVTLTDTRDSSGSCLFGLGQFDFSADTAVLVGDKTNATSDFSSTRAAYYWTLKNTSGTGTHVQMSKLKIEAL